MRLAAAAAHPAAVPGRAADQQADRRARSAGTRPACCTTSARLVRTGLPGRGGERRGTRGAREVPYRATGKSWVLRHRRVERTAAGAKGIALVEAFLRGRAPGRVRERRQHPDGTAAHARPSTTSSPDRMFDLVEEFRLRALGGRAWSLFVGLHRGRPAGVKAVLRPATRATIGGR